MASPAFTISPCTPSDLPSMINIYEAAFQNSPIYAFMWPPTLVPAASKRAWLRSRFLATMDTTLHPEMRTFKVVEAATGALVAWARWQFPHVFSAAELQLRAAREHEKKNAGNPWPEGARGENCELFFGRIAEGKKAWYRDEDMYLLHLLVTDVAHQRLGLGQMLLEHVLPLADQYGHKAYLDALPPGYRLYAKTGFETRERWVKDVREWGIEEDIEVEFMVREPRVREVGV